MKTIMVFLSFCLFSLCSAGQTSQVLETDDGPVTVKTDAAGLSQLSFTAAEWSTIRGSAGLKTERNLQVCIIIASQKRDCKGGVGFRCGIFDCALSSPPPSVGKHVATQPAAVSYAKDGSVLVRFLHPIDWAYFQSLK